MSVDLTARERRMVDGGEGPAVAMAMRIVMGLARVRRATHLLDVTGAHVDSCLYHGRSGLDFAQRLLDLGGSVAVPTTLNVGSVDLVHPHMVRDAGEAPGAKAAGRKLMETYAALGARPTFTCAPYQLTSRPTRGEHVAWAESNAIVFANSVLGARTDRYGDFLDICAAITGKVPAAGLHLDEQRRARLSIDVRGVSAHWFASELGYVLIGYVVGLRSEDRVPAIVGLPSDTTEDQLKALGSTAASSGAVALFHAVGLTPEAPTLDSVTAEADLPVIVVEDDDLRRARRELTTARTDTVDVVSVGTPHASLAEIHALAEALAGRRIAERCRLFVCTGRGVHKLAEEMGDVERIEAAGGTFVLDTCTYIAPVLPEGTRTAMTNSGKWAHYAPANLGIDVTLGSLSECVESAVAGHRVLDD